MKQLGKNRKRLVQALSPVVLAGGLGMVVLATLSYFLEDGARGSGDLFGAAIILGGAGVCFALLVVAVLHLRSSCYRFKVWLLAVVPSAAMLFLTVLFVCLPPGSEQQHFARFVWGVTIGTVLAAYSTGLLLLLGRAEPSSLSEK